MAIGEALGGIVGGVLGNNAAKMDRRHQKDMMKSMVEEYNKLGYPPDYSKALVLQELQRQGVYTPEMEQDLNDSIAESAMGQLTEDPNLLDAQKSALASLQNRAKVGLSAEDRAALNQVRSEVQRDSEAKRQQILQQMQSQGMGGSGASLMAQLQSAQGASDQASAASDSLMSQAQQRALQALSESGAMASGMRNQDFSVNSAKASALDERNRFLAENSINRQQRNVGSMNQAQRLNLDEQQRIADANAQMQNAEKQRQATAQQQTYQDKLKFVAGKTGQQQSLADFYGNTANAKAQAQVNMGKGIGGLGDSAAKAYATGGLSEAMPKK
jgi:hypothetical protein